MRRLTLDDNRCTGHGRCYDIAPTLFEADEYGHSRVVAAEVEDGDVGLARKAERACPEYAITLET